MPTKAQLEQQVRTLRAQLCEQEAPDGCEPSAQEWAMLRLALDVPKDADHQDLLTAATAAAKCTDNYDIGDRESDDVDAAIELYDCWCEHIGTEDDLQIALWRAGVIKVNEDVWTALGALV